MLEQGPSQTWMSCSLRLEAIPAAGRDSAQGGQHDETGVTTGCSGGPSAGFITTEFIQENLLPPLPDKLDVNAIEEQVGEECSRGEREGLLVSVGLFGYI